MQIYQIGANHNLATNLTQTEHQLITIFAVKETHMRMIIRSQMRLAEIIGSICGQLFGIIIAKFLILPEVSIWEIFMALVRIQIGW